MGAGVGVGVGTGVGSAGKGTLATPSRPKKVDRWENRAANGALTRAPAKVVAMPGMRTGAPRPEEKWAVGRAPGRCNDSDSGLVVVRTGRDTGEKWREVKQTAKAPVLSHWAGPIQAPGDGDGNCGANDHKTVMLANIMPAGEREIPLTATG